MKDYQQLIRHSGNKDLFHALALSVAAMTGRHPFHIHTEGLRGTGKTTIIRAAGRLLPPIVKVKGCVYNCHPDRPHCPDHKDLSREEISRIGQEVVPCPFLEISHSAKIGTVLGSIDLGRLVDPARPLAALLPGTILQAHRGVIFIDEINRLADTAPELADVLLDVMGTKPGRVQVEETGLPTVEMPAEVTVWAASNPDEEPGALSQVRKQLADRFDLAVTMGRPSEHRSVMAILSGRGDVGKTEREQATFVAGDYRSIVVEDGLRSMLASIYVDFGLESLRAVEGLETATRLNALYADRQRATLDDLVAVAPLVLSHRTDNATLAGIMKYLQTMEGGLSQASDMAVAGAREQGESRPADSGEGGDNPSRLARFWAELRQRFGGRSRPQERTGSAQAAKSGHSSPGTGAGETGVSDPNTVNIVAPPLPATPLAQLPPDRFVSGEDGGKNA